MIKSQIALIAGGLLLLFGLFFWGNTTPPSQKQETETTGTETSGGFDMEAYLAAAKSKLSVEELDSVKQVESALKTASESTISVKFYKELAELWERSGNFLIFAHYLGKVAELNPAIITWKQAGDAYLFATRHKDEQIKQYAAGQSVECYNTLLELDPDNTAAKISLARSFIEGQNNVMPGVQLLLGVVEKEPSNTDANMILGRLSMVSGQFDKAIKRFETILEVDKENAEAWLLLAEAFSAAGNKEKAIEALEKCKTVVSDPEFSEKIDQQIKQIKDS